MHFSSDEKVVISSIIELKSLLIIYIPSLINRNSIYFVYIKSSVNLYIVTLIFLLEHTAHLISSEAWSLIGSVLGFGTLCIAVRAVLIAKGQLTKAVEQFDQQIILQGKQFESVLADKLQAKVDRMIKGEQDEEEKKKLIARKRAIVFMDGETTKRLLKYYGDHARKMGMKETTVDIETPSQDI